jgi:hypothetical protein
MTLSRMGIIGVALLVASCAEMEQSGKTDLALDTYAPPAHALNIAETRAKEYWAKHQEQIGRDTQYLAIQSDTIFANEIPDLYRKLLYSPAATSSELEDYENNYSLEIYCVSIFDTRSGKLYPGGYAVVDLPHVGQVARFGNYVAKYIGTGS